jgi:hypothetical protein
VSARQLAPCSDGSQKRRLLQPSEVYCLRLAPLPYAYTVSVRPVKEQHVLWRPKKVGVFRPRRGSVTFRNRNFARPLFDSVECR